MRPRRSRSFSSGATRSSKTWSPVSPGRAANLTGFSLQVGKLMPKRLDLVSELVSQAGIIALLVNPNYPIPEPIMRDVQDAARAKGLQLHILKAATDIEIEPAFA